MIPTMHIKLLLVCDVVIASSSAALLAVNISIDGGFWLGLAAFFTAVISGYTAIMTTRTHREVRTINGYTLAQLAEKGETERIQVKDAAGGELTGKEDQHMDVMEKAGQVPAPDAGKDKP